MELTPANEGPDPIGIDHSPDLLQYFAGYSAGREKRDGNSTGDVDRVRGKIGEGGGGDVGEVGGGCVGGIGLEVILELVLGVVPFHPVGAVGGDVGIGG